MELQRYNLILGRSCNMACSYCSQGMNKPMFIGNMPNPKEVVKYFPKEGEYTIKFSGGEPLLYWDFMYELCLLIRAINPKVVLYTGSNGVLLTVDMAKKANEVGLGISFSHDGKNHEKSRGYTDILKSNPAPYLELVSRGISAVCSSVNPNFYEVWNYFEEFRIKYGLSKREQIEIIMIKDICGNTPEEFFIYNDPNFETMLDKVFSNMRATLGYGNLNSYEWDLYLPFIEKLRKRAYSTTFGSFCGADTEHCHIDVYGNLYDCQNSIRPFGNVATHGLRTALNNQYKNNKTCLECEVYQICGGHCYLSDENKKKYRCYTFKQQLSRVLDILKC